MSAILKFLGILANVGTVVSAIVLLVLNVFIWSVLYGVLPAEPTISDRMRDPNCRFLQSAEVSVAGHTFKVPALKHTKIDFPYERGRDYRYVNAVWHGRGFGFCEDFLSGGSVADRVTFSSMTAKRIAADLNLPSPQSSRWLSIGTHGRSTWLNFPAGVDPNLAPHVLIEDTAKAATHEDGSPWMSYYYSAGELEGIYRLSAKCTALKHTPKINCAVRLTRKSDDMIFEAWSLQLDELPKDNHDMPPSFALLVERLPLLQDYLQ